MSDNIEELRKKNQEAYDAYQNNVNTATNELVANRNSVSADLQSALSEAEDKRAQAAKTYSEIVRGMQADAKMRIENQKNADKMNAARDSKLSLFGGIADAAAALVNLIGTSKGANSAQYASPQPAWQERINALRKEREARIERYKNEADALEEQSARLDYSTALDLSNAEKEDAIKIAARNDETNSLNHQSAIQSAKTGLEAKLADTNLELQGIKIENEAQARRERNAETAANNAATQALKYQDLVAKWRNKGYDIETGKWKNPASGQFDLDVPSGSSSDLTESQLKSARDRVARQAGLSNYDEYLKMKKGKKKNYKRWAEDNPRVDQLLNTLQHLESIDKDTRKNLWMDDIFVQAMLGPDEEGWELDVDSNEGKVGVKRESIDEEFAD